MSTLTTFENLFDNRVRDAASRFTTQQKDDAIGEAVKLYSQVRPVEAVQDYAGDGSAYDFALPTGWVPKLSTITQIEYPAGEREPETLEREDWQYYRTTSAVKIRLRHITPATGKTMRVTFTKPHTVDGSGSSIPSVDEEAVANLAGAIGLRQLAAVYANSTDPTIAADSVNYRTKSQEYSALAKELEGRYRVHLGLDKESEAPAASTFIDVDQDSTLGQDKLTHPNRYR